MTDLRIAVLILSSGLCKTFFAQSLGQLFQYRHWTRSRPDVSSMVRKQFVQVGSVIHANREVLVDRALEWGATHVLFIDDDMAFNPKAVEIMLGRKQAFVACNYPRRVMPIKFTACALDMKTPMVTSEAQEGLEEAGYTGFGLSLIEADVIRAIPKPRFLPRWLEDLQSYTTEDWPFCEKVRAAGYKVLVDHDASKYVGHIGEYLFEWAQYQAPAAEAA
jgi:hypothetical protein